MVHAMLVFVSLWNFMQRAPAKQYYKHNIQRDLYYNTSTLHHYEVNKYCGYQAYYRCCACVIVVQFFSIKYVRNVGIFQATHHQ